MPYLERERTEEEKSHQEQLSAVAHAIESILNDAGGLTADDLARIFGLIIWRAADRYFHTTHTAQAPTPTPEVN